jgi:hypothetical protein
LLHYNNQSEVEALKKKNLLITFVHIQSSFESNSKIIWAFQVSVFECPCILFAIMNKSTILTDTYVYCLNGIIIFYIIY